MASFDKEAANQLSAVCEFCTTARPTGVDVEMLYQRLEEIKTERQWSREEARLLKCRLGLALELLSEYMHMQRTEISVVNPSIESIIVRPGMQHVTKITDDMELNIKSPLTELKTEQSGIRFITRITNDLNDIITLYIKEPDDDAWMEHKLPLITFKIIELIVRLPENTLRICDSLTCENPFVSRHKTKKYCSATCRSRENIYATRRRLKERLKDAD